MGSKSVTGKFKVVKIKCTTLLMETINMKKSSVIILAAGESSRMGKPKFLLQYDENTTFLEKIMQEYEAFGCKQIIVVLNEQGAVLLIKNKPKYIPENIKIIINHYPEKGRFFSLKLGLKALDKRKKVFLHNIDNPLVNSQLLRLLSEKISGFDYAVPRYKNRGGHPILLSKKVIKSIITEDENNVNLKNYLNSFRKAIVATDDENILLNINTKEEYEEFITFFK